ncbi:MAG: nitrite reductase small subunit NirD [Gammaproteobacteria bacterium]
MSEWVDVCAIDDLQPDSGVCAWVAGKQVALFYMPKDGALYAIANLDPFSQANVLSRGMIGDLNGTPMVASPMYKQHFNLMTGICFEDAGVGVDVYETKMDNGRVLVRIEG